ncbi:hypothetical protein GCM10022222_71000 [Amycolatopsis ultiminotia]|uniref:Uncharacterized protein n=1 Tax=Amycolatopsis ultiminotia TaxID=543629 RepID=A0ABP6Y4P4_9PSEU
MVRQAGLDGAAHLMLPPGVRHLDETTAVFEAMLNGWECQQQSRFLRVETIAPRVRRVRRFAEFTGQYPWQWDPAEIEAFTGELVSGPAPLAHSTVRGYQVTLRLFCEFVTDSRYGWAGECELAVRGGTRADLPRVEHRGAPGRARMPARPPCLDL